MRRSRHRRTPAQGSAAPMSKTVALACFFSLAATLVSHSDGQQMDPGVMQRQVQQQMGGSTCGGGGVPPPNRIVQLVSAVAASGATVAHSVREHPRATVAATVAVGTAVWAGKETRRSGLLVRRSPRVSLLRPSDAYLSWVLETAADAPIASPLRGVILSPLEDADAEEEQQEGSQQQADGAASARGCLKHLRHSTARAEGASGRRGSDDFCRSSISLSGEETAGSVREVWEALHRGKAVAGEGTYTEEAWHGGKGGKGKKGAVKSVTSGVRVGRGLGLYHKFAQGLGNLDVFDGRSDCELMAAESSTEDVGSTLGLLTRSTMGTYSLSALRVVLRRERSVPVPRVDDDDVDAGRHGGGRKRSRARSGRDSGSSGRRKGRRRSGTSTKKGKGVRKEEDNESGEPSAVGAEAESHRQYTLALSAVEGAGWSGTWVFRVTYDVETDEVWFQTRLAQRKGALGTTTGGDQAGRVAKVNQDMLARANKHAAVLRTREEQFARVSSLAQSRARDAKELARDRILNPEKYKRVHRYMREDSHTTGGATARPARWGEERRRNDIRLK
ncbi:unnamed protein product [Scytosiphon promiscuus]